MLNNVDNATREKILKEIEQTGDGLMLTLAEERGIYPDYILEKYKINIPYVDYGDAWWEI